MATSIYRLDTSSHSVRPRGGRLVIYVVVASDISKCVVGVNSPAHDSQVLA